MTGNTADTRVEFFRSIFGTDEISQRLAAPPPVAKCCFFDFFFFFNFLSLSLPHSLSLSPFYVYYIIYTHYYLYSIVLFVFSFLTAHVSFFFFCSGESKKNFDALF